MFQFNESHHLSILWVVMFHELDVVIRFTDVLHIFQIMEQEGKPGMVPCVIDLVKYSISFS